MTNTIPHNSLSSILLEHVVAAGGIPLFAAESGSRGWGFSSPDSDYDGRHIYLWPASRYLSPFPAADQLAYKDPVLDLDFEGWELGKVLRTLRRGNPVVLEWVQSPVIYHDNNGFGKSLLETFGTSQLFNTGASVGHYMGMASKAMGADREPGSWRTKKLFYALRASLAGLYAVDRGSMPPMEWTTLLSACTSSGRVSAALSGELVYLMAEKVAHGEKHAVPESYIGVVLEFLRESSTVLRSFLDGNTKPAFPPEEPYVEFFQHSLQKWGHQ